MADANHQSARGSLGAGWVGLGVLLLPLLAIAGCSVRPDGSNGQRRNFTAPAVPYEMAYRRATDYFNTCVRGFVGFSPNVTTGNIYADEHRAELRTANGSGIIVARVGIVAAGNGSAVDVVTMKRPGLWNAKDLDAIEQAIVTGTRHCP